MDIRKTLRITVRVNGGSNELMNAFRRSISFEVEAAGFAFVTSFTRCHVFEIRNKNDSKW